MLRLYLRLKLLKEGQSLEKAVICRDEKIKVGVSALNSKSGRSKINYAEPWNLISNLIVIDVLIKQVTLFLTIKVANIKPA